MFTFAAVIASLTMVWGYAKGWYSTIIARVIETTIVSPPAATAMVLYAMTHFERSRFATNFFDSEITYVRPVGKSQVISFEELISKENVLFWHGRVPFVLSQDRNGSWNVTMKYLKGTFKADEIILKAVTWYNEHAAEITTCRRYAVFPIFGTDGRQMGIRATENGIVLGAGGNGTQFNNRRLQKILGWKTEDIGPKLTNNGSALECLALDDQLRKLAEEISCWKKEKNWYRARSIPWRKGILLYGEPGTGKTAFVRAVAEDEDMPIFVYDLSTLYNEELFDTWKRMLNHVPCIALLEDFDAVFDGRKNVAGNHLTFDALLNCLDGVSRTDGLLTVVTTNHVGKLDAALTRAGRLEHAIETPHLSVDGRLKLAKKILIGHKDEIERLVNAHEDVTGAEFQFWCEQKALELKHLTHGRADSKIKCLCNST